MGTNNGKRERAWGRWRVASEIALLSLRKNWNPGLQDLVKSRQASWSLIFALPCVSASFSFLVCQSPQHRRKWPQICIYMSQDPVTAGESIFLCFSLSIPISWLRIFVHACVCVCVCVCAQSCQTLCDPMDWSPPGSSVHGISLARILEWVAISFSRASSQPRDQSFVSCIFCIGNWSLDHCSPGKPMRWDKDWPNLVRLLVLLLSIAHGIELACIGKIWGGGCSGYVAGVPEKRWGSW